jgi:hypothetical protein
MTAVTHPGAIIHCWDHLVITLRGADGTETAFLSLYAIAYSKSLGAGHVALLQVHDAPAGPISATLTDDPGLGLRQQARLLAMGDDRMTRTGAPRIGRFTREPYDRSGFGFRIESEIGDIHARWDAPGEPFWVDGQAGGLSDTEDIWAMFVAAGRARITVGGNPVPGEPFEDDVWLPKLGRSLSSAHGAFAEVRVEPVSDRAIGSGPAGPR